MVLNRKSHSLQPHELPLPTAKPNQLRIKVSVCGICRTDLHVIDGELDHPKQTLIPGHQIVGYIDMIGSEVEARFPNTFQVNQRVGIPWLGGSCGQCFYCTHHRENLCNDAVYTGYQIDGGFAEYTVADASYCFKLPSDFSDIQAAPLLCAGLIGYRAYRLCKQVQSIGLYGFGAAAHILIQVAHYQRKKIYVFTRQGDIDAQKFALSLGASWVGDSQQQPPDELDAAIIFAPIGDLVPTALKVLRKGGKVICAGIHMSDIPSFGYDLLWGERSIESVANLTRQDGEEFLPLAAQIPVQTHVHSYPLEAVNEALDDLRHGRFTGAAVVQM